MSICTVLLCKPLLFLFPVFAAPCGIAAKCKYFSLPPKRFWKSSSIFLMLITWPLAPWIKVIGKWQDPREKCLGWEPGTWTVVKIQLIEKKCKKCVHISLEEEWYLLCDFCLLRTYQHRTATTLLKNFTRLFFWILTMLWSGYRKIHLAMEANETWKQP